MPPNTLLAGNEKECEAGSDSESPEYDGPHRFHWPGVSGCGS